jgi:hypothetical protein
MFEKFRCNSGVSNSRSDGKEHPRSNQPDRNQQANYSDSVSPQLAPLFLLPPRFHLHSNVGGVGLERLPLAQQRLRHAANRNQRISPTTYEILLVDGN